MRSGIEVEEGERDKACLVLVAFAALVTTAAWAAPREGSRPKAKLTFDSSGHLTPTNGQVMLMGTIAFEESCQTWSSRSRPRCAPWG